MAENQKMPFRYKGVHACEAVVLACIDFRFWRETMQWVDEILGIKSYDFPKMPGAAKAINEAHEGDVALSSIGVPCELHHVKKIVIVNHSDCGAYGGSGKFVSSEEEQAFHEGELRKARDIVKQKYPEQEVILAYAKLVDDGDSIEFINVA